MQEDQKIYIPAGVGYWNLAHYPWGGDFHRLSEDYVFKIERVLPKKRFIVRYNEEEYGFTYAHGMVTSNKELNGD